MDLPDKTQQNRKEKLKPVVNTATQVDRSASKRLLDYLFAESPKQLAVKIGHDVIVPRLKAGFEEAANSFLSGMLWGSSANRPNSGLVGRPMLRGGGVNYSAISSNNPSLLQARQANVSRSSGNYKDVVVPTLQEAELLLASLYDLHNQYRAVAVADLYELAGISPQISDNSYGWTSLEGARISKVRDGYLLELPRPTLI